MSKKLKMLTLVTVTFVGFLGVFFYSDPIRVFQIKEYLELRWNGVQARSTTHFYYFEKNNCQNKGCHCVLMIHGLGDFAYTWGPTLMSEKMQNTRMVAINLPGSLKSPLLEKDSDYSLSHMSDLIKDEVLPMCQSWNIVGNSYGGWLAIRLSQKDSRVQSLFLNAPAGLKKDYSHITEYFINPSVKEAQSFYTKAYAHPKDVPNFVFESVVQRAKKVPVIQMLKSVQEKDFITRPLRLNIPTKIAWGDSDGVLLSKWASEYKSYLVGADLEIFKGCGHIPQKECFTDFEKSLVEFLKL